jgi:hypothetical protein
VNSRKKIWVEDSIFEAGNTVFGDKKSLFYTRIIGGFGLRLCDIWEQDIVSATCGRKIGTGCRQGAVEVKTVPGVSFEGGSPRAERKFG